MLGLKLIHISKRGPWWWNLVILGLGTACHLFATKPYLNQWWQTVHKTLDETNCELDIRCYTSKKFWKELIYISSQQINRAASTFIPAHTTHKCSIQWSIFQEDLTFHSLVHFKEEFAVSDGRFLDDDFLEEPSLAGLSSVMTHHNLGKSVQIHSLQLKQVSLQSGVTTLVT